MNWTELRPILRQKFGRDFHFYNDGYKSGTRRIKICTSDAFAMCSFLKNTYPELDVKIYNEERWNNRYPRVTIHYR